MIPNFIGVSIHQFYDRCPYLHCRCDLITHAFPFWCLPEMLISEYEIVHLPLLPHFSPQDPSPAPKNIAIRHITILTMSIIPTKNPFIDPAIKNFLLTLIFRTPYTASQTLAILAHRFTTHFSIEEIQSALASWRNERDEVYLRIKEMGRVEYIWFWGREVEEAEEIERELKREGMWPE